MPQVFEQSLFLFRGGRTVVADALVLLLPLQMHIHSGGHFFPPVAKCVLVTNTASKLDYNLKTGLFIPFAASKY